MKRLTFKILAALLCMCMLMPMLAACNNTEDPTEPPTAAPTEAPTSAPTEEPTEEPTEKPTEAPTPAPTEEPTEPTEEVCAHAETETLAAVEATCTRTGLTEGKKCKACGEITVAQTETEMLPHTPTGVSEVKATCTEGGLTFGQKCLYCDAVLLEQTPTPALGHFYPGASVTCSRCGYTIDMTTPDAYTYYGKVQYICGAGKNGSAAAYDIMSNSTASGVYPEVSGIETDVTAQLAISGFMLVSGYNVEKYVWSFDGKTWNDCVGGAYVMAQATHINEAKKLFADFDETSEYKKAKYTNIYADLREYEGQTLDAVIFGACVDEYDAIIPVIKITDVHVKYEPAPGEGMNSAHSGYIKHAFDILEIGGQRQDHNSTNHTISYGDPLQFNGWVGFDQPIKRVGYVINNGSMTSSAEWMRDPEGDVLNIAGQHAKRFYISVQTAAIPNGTHRLYFVAELRDGTVIVLQTYIITMSGGFENDADKPDGEVIKAEPDKSAPTNTSVSIDGTTATTGLGLTYSFLGGKFENNRFSFSGSSAHKVTFMGASRTELSGEFNRFKLRYVSSGPIKATLTYTDGGETVSDVVYLEAAPSGATFTCLTLGYLSGNMATDLKQIEFVACDGGNASFVLCDVETEQYEVYNSNIKFIQNSRYRVGIKLAWGGGICYVEDRKDGIDDLFNLINQHDTGRLVQQSYYGTKGENDNYQMGDYNGNAWRYNPVQGGDIWGNHSRIIDIVVEEYSLYIKAQPQDWGHNGDITPSYMENIYTIYPDIIDVWNRFVDYSNYNHPKASQELPAFYTVGYLDTFYYAVDGDPWATPHCEPDLDFWGRNKGDGRFETGQYKNTDQTWSAFTNADGSFGLGLFTPNSCGILAGRFGYDDDPKNHQLPEGTQITGYGPTKDSMSMGCAYIAPVNSFQIKCYQAVEYSYIMATGSIDQIRSTFQSHEGFTSNSSIEHQGWA
ncbi:MAG: hypothetical protein IJW65_00795 [Clostridia bacterium]|nr:hypothetical protein [Clostridia bacterium]